MRIDVHAHYWSDAYLDMLVDLGRSDATTQRGIGAGGGAELEARLRLMDRAGVDIQVLSAAPQLPHGDNEPEPRPRHATSTTSMPRWCRRIQIVFARSRPRRCHTSMLRSPKYPEPSTNWAWSG
jgi:hypothetical protein